MVAIRFLIPGNVRHSSGGNKYNAKLAEHLSALGANVEVRTVDGGWPVGRTEDRGRLAGELDGATTVIADGLVACGAPDEIAEATRGAARVWILSHARLTGHPDLETRALKAAAGIICTSSHAAAELTFAYGVDDILVATPGVEPVEIASGSQPPRIIAVAALLPNKDQMLLVEALNELRDLPWTAALIGNMHADSAYAAKVRAAVVGLGLEGRIAITGELSGSRLEQEWRAADLSVLVSKSETFGMVVTESLAHGLPVLVRKGTGAVEALGDSGAGAALRLGHGPEPLARALESWLRNAALRQTWRAAALRARDVLPGWDSTASTVLEALLAAPRQQIRAIPTPGLPLMPGKRCRMGP
ncbi:glycosyltransferase family 4 protein [Arthrobacter sp. NA-172]|uniref:glycosyltransferase family 4 protein n=1 Tax=Arthrobacter sp. NA-172 TaxID=3367524 RepID=UPI00375439E4